MKTQHWIAAGLAATLALAGSATLARDGGPKGPGFFKQMDADGDGMLTREEMQARGKERMKEADTNGDGFLDRDEMMAAVNTRAAGMVDHMLERMDTDKDGKLSEEELMARGEKHGGFDRMDKDGDGAISRDEFREARKEMRQHRHGRGPGEDHGN